MLEEQLCNFPNCSFLSAIRKGKVDVPYCKFYHSYLRKNNYHILSFNKCIHNKSKIVRKVHV